MFFSRGSMAAVIHHIFIFVCGSMQQDATEKRTKDTYGPPIGKRLLLFVDDLNMPRVDTYGTQQPIALLKLFIDRKVRH